MDVVTMLSDIADIGQDPSGGYRRFTLTDSEQELGEWFESTAAALGLDVELDRNGNRWAWWGDASGEGAVVTGSHLDSVPRGGPYDGPLGVVSAFSAIHAMKLSGVTPQRPLAVVCFAEEEGGRFGVACLGSRLATGAISAERALSLRDADGISLAEALTRVGRKPRDIGVDSIRMSRIAMFIELHVEQGRALVDQQQPLAIGTRIWPHGRWRYDFTGRADHAGTARMTDRDDPMQGLAALIRVARDRALMVDSPNTPTRATVGRVQVLPNAINAVPHEVQAWLDARAWSDQALEELVAAITSEVPQALVFEESRTSEQHFDSGLVHNLASILDTAPLLDTGAGHDAGILSDAGIPSAMIFVRNPSGISHAPEEHAEDSDARIGAEGLADVLTRLVTAT
jgi:beta-ureidopropionase / N-carbamoyl-L-amino-acid hydrolase